MTVIEVQDATCGYGGGPVIRGLSLEVAQGEFLGILGPNGSGKTTLLRAITGIVPLEAGRIRLSGADVAALDPRAIARQVACVMQDGATSIGAANLAFSVREIVTLGRTPYLARTGWETRRDREAVEQAMELAEVADLADRPVTELSGGERQRAFIALALAQECDIILLDEPTNHLDIAHQIAVLELFAGLTHRHGKTSVGVFHDLNLAADYCDRILLLKAGRSAAVGPPGEVLTAGTVRDIYGAAVLVEPNPATGRPHVFLSRPPERGAETV